MKCFFNPKGKSKSKGISKSATELKQGEKSDISAKKKGLRPSNSLCSRSIPELYKEKEQNLRVFSLQELVDATNGFSRLLKIGEGGFGSVYKGIIKPTTPNGEPLVVAIKELNQHSLQVLPSFSVFSVRSHVGWGGEQNLSLVPSICVLKTLRGSPKGKVQRGQYLLAVGLNRYKWYQSQTPDDVPARKLFLGGG